MRTLQDCKENWLEPEFYDAIHKEDQVLKEQPKQQAKCSKTSVDDEFEENESKVWSTAASTIDVLTGHVEKIILELNYTYKKYSTAGLRNVLQ